MGWSSVDGGLLLYLVEVGRRPAAVLNPPTRSSSDDPRPCITPSRLTNPMTTSLRMLSTPHFRSLSRGPARAFVNHLGPTRQCLIRGTTALRVLRICPFRTRLLSKCFRPAAGEGLHHEPGEGDEARRLRPQPRAVSTVGATSSPSIVLPLKQQPSRSRRRWRRRPGRSV